MSEEKPKERTSQDIQLEFNNLCFRAGSLQFEIDQKKADLDMLNKTMRDLSFEYIKVKNSESAAASAPADKEPAPNA